MLARKSTLIIYNQIFIGIFGLISIFFVSRYMGPEALGQIGFAMGFVGLFSIILDLGFVKAHVKKVSEVQDPSSFIATFILIKLILICSFSLTVILSINSAYLALNLSILEKQVIYLTLLLFIFQNIYSIIQHTFAAKKEIAKNQIPLFFSNLIRLPFVIFVCLASMSVINLALVNSLAAFVALIFYLYYFRGTKIGMPSFSVFREYLSYSLPLFLVTAFGILVIYLDKALLGFFYSDAELGQYMGAHRIYHFLMFIPISIVSVYFPTISKYYSEGKSERFIENFTHTSEKYAFLFIIPLLILAFIHSDLIVKLILGDLFKDSIEVLQIFILVVIFNFISFPYTQLILGAGKPKHYASVIVAGNITHLGFNIILIPNNILGYEVYGLGAMGAAYSLLFGTLAQTVFSRFIVKKDLRISSNPRSLIWFSLSSLLLSVCYYFNDSFELEWYFSLIFSFLMLLSYFCILYALGEVTKREFSFLVKTLNPKLMSDYIKSEVNSK